MWWEIETGAKTGANVGQSLEAARGKGHVPPGASRRNIAHILAPQGSFWTTELLQENKRGLF